MNYRFLNSEGFGDTEKYSFIHETIKKHNKLDFFAISETGRSYFSTHFLNHLSKGGGILVGVNSSKLHVKNIVTGELCVNFQLSSKCDNWSDP
jgi:hypothetical protein